MTTFERVFVWLGGGVFVGSLAYCFWWFAVALGMPRRAAGLPPLLFDVVLFSLFAAHHSVFAREPLKQWIAATIRPELVRSVYVWIASLLLVAVCAFWRPVGGELFDNHGVSALLHAGLQLGGVWLIARAVATIDPLELAGIRPPSQRSALQVGGPYRLVRHPLYLGWILATFGAAHMTGDRAAFAVITAAYLFAAVPFEERSLVQSFGEAYTRYQRDVRWRIVPFIY